VREVSDENVTDAELLDETNHLQRGSAKQSVKDGLDFLCHHGDFNGS